MSEGVFAVHRGVFKHPMFLGDEYSRRDAWLWLVGNAVWEAKRVRVNKQMIELDRGQLAFSEGFLAGAWKWNKSKVHRFLAELKDDGMISLNPNLGVNRISIMNYDSYAFDGTKKRTTREPAANRPRTKEEEGKELKKEEEGKRERVRRAPASVIPDGWKLSEQDSAHALGQGFSPSKVLLMKDAFYDHHRAKGSRMVDWSAAWRTWVRNEIKFNGAPNGKAIGKPSIIGAADDLIDRIQGWGTPGGFEVGGGEDAAVVRLLPKGGRERPGDLHGGSCGGSGGVRPGGDLSGDGPEDGTPAADQIFAKSR